MYQRQRTRPPNYDRWLISYADFITLLFAFFVVLFASSHADRARAKRVSESVSKAFNGGVAAIEKPRVNHAKSGGSSNLAPVLTTLVQVLHTEIQTGQLRVHMEQRGIVVSLSQASFFPSGEDVVDPKMIGSLAKVANIVATLPNLIRLEGHTDAIPIHTTRFRSNWDLSSARAIAMMDLLSSRWHILPARLAVTGYAETIPIESNDTEAGRARNRRVDLVILNRAGALLEPQLRPELVNE